VSQYGTTVYDAGWQAEQKWTSTEIKKARQSGGQNQRADDSHH